MVGTVALGFISAASLFAQQGDSFHWMDFHSAKDQDVIVWVTRALENQKWTAIREIGVQYDAALVVTTERASALSAANADTFTIWSVSLTNHALTPLLHGVNLRWVDSMKLRDGGEAEPAMLYDNCTACAAETYFTTFHYDMEKRGFIARWMRGGQCAPVWSENTPAGVALTQAYAGLAEANGREFVAVWNHFDYGNRKPAEDFVYRYDLEPSDRSDRGMQLGTREAEAMKLRICRAEDVLPGLARGQDGPLCETLQPRPERKPVTTPPANNRGRMGTGAKH
jgi:hypothetical protein